jgi:pimeloyl-ACP methyl ester carboxylesterase
MAERTEILTHNRVKLALHALRGPMADGATRPLLFLHGLGERSPVSVPQELSTWPGPIHALDFTGHGDSTVPRGGGYTCELLMADADVALARLGPCTVVGRGLGAYVALLLAGGRPDQVRGVILRDGPGLAGGGSGSTSPTIPFVDVTQPSPPDPFALVELSTDVRPPDYACVFARQAAQMSGLPSPIAVCCCERPGWLAAVIEELDAQVTPLPQALARYAQVG